MKIQDIIFGGASIISLAFSFPLLKDPLYQMASIIGIFLVLIVVYLRSNIQDIQQKVETSSLEIKRLNEKIKIHGEIADHEIRLKNLEVKKR